MKEILKQFFLKIKAKFYNKTEIDTALSGKSDISHNHDDRYFTETEVTNKLAEKSDVGHKHSADDITSGTLPVANGGTGVTTQADINKAFIGNLEVGNSDVTDGTEFVSSYASDSGFSSTEEGSLNKPYKRQFIKVWNYIKDKISSVLGLTASDYSGRARIATNADFAKNMYHQVFDLTSLDNTKFYPLVCSPSYYFSEVAILSEGGSSALAYNQNRIHFDISTTGWSDTPFTLNIREYACYDNSEITIGCIGRGVHNGTWALWLRGGVRYICSSMSSDLSLQTSDYAYGDEVYTVGTNYYGGTNSNVDIVFTPQSTITEGAYSNKPIKAPNLVGNLTGNVTGNSATATTASSADKAVSVVDYGDPSSTIQIGFHGAGLTASELGYIAGYKANTNGIIKDVSKSVLQSWLGLSNYLPLSGGTVTGKLDVKAAGICIPTSQPSSLSNGDIWVG